MATVTNQEFVERPYWYLNTETGRSYYDLYACIGWPTEIQDDRDGLPGYAAVIGVAKKDTEGFNPVNASFQLLDEIFHEDVPTLLKGCLDLREKYGFGIRPDLLSVWFGDPDRFLTTLALFNEALVADNEMDEFLISPPDDFYVTKIFDNYVRDIKSVLLKETRRFYFGHNDVLKNKLRDGVRKDDPCVVAIGGLVHSLLARCRWQDSRGETVFNVEAR